MLSHPNIVQFYGACLQYPHLAIVMEYLDLGSLDKILKFHAKKLNYDIVLKFALDIGN